MNYSSFKKQHKLFEGFRKFLREEENQQPAQPQQPAEPQQGGSWPGSPPKTVKITANSNLDADTILGVWKKLAAMNPPKNAQKVLAAIGGPEQLVKNVKALEKNFAGSQNNPPRIKMPVVDPDKDMVDLKWRLKKGKLDVKKPFADWDKIEADAETEHGMRGKAAGSQRRKMREGNLDNKFPQDLTTQTDAVQNAFLTKGEKDGNPTDDSQVTMSEVPIDVATSFPTQKEVYLDKSMWNILNFGPTKKGGVAFGKPNLIAIQAGNKNFILDGHHRWSSAYISGGPGAKIRVQGLKGLDIGDAIAALRSYGNARDNKQKG